MKRRECAKCGRNRAEKFYTSARGRVCESCRKERSRTAARGQRLLETYGITLGEYDEILDVQGNKCAICGRKPKYNLDIDHDHQAEKVFAGAGMDPVMARRMTVRGLLCKLCNRRLLPAVRDRVEPLAAAISYLQCPPAYPILETDE